MLEDTVRALEELRDPSWDLTSSRERFASLIEHVVAFRVRVRAVHSMFKLSQDMPDDVRDRVRDDHRLHRLDRLAELMERVDPRFPH